ncbi:MAG: hypothetical protein ACRDN9_03855 [Streptosporangiaceae bacterium]
MGTGSQGGGSEPRHSTRGRAPPPEPLLRDLLDAARGLLAIRSPLDAELLVSELFGTWWGLSPDAADVERVFGDALVDYTTRARTPAALALLTGITHLGGDLLAARAAKSARTLRATGVREPGWARHVGRVEADGCWLSRDVYGDQASVICTFSYAGLGSGERHALVVLVDLTLSGMAKDAWCTSEVDTLLDSCRRQTRDSALTVFESYDPADARAMLQPALAATDEASRPPVTETFGAYRAFVRARLRTLPEGGRAFESATYSPDERAVIAARFLASEETSGLSDRAAAGRLADLIVAFGCDRDLGRPLRVSPLKTEVFLLEWLPSKVMLDPTDKEAIPHVLAAWVRWAGRRQGLPPEGVRHILDTLWDASAAFDDTYQDPRDLDHETIARLLPEGDLEALPRRAFAFAFPLATCGDAAAVDLADPGGRRHLVEAEHPNPYLEDQRERPGDRASHLRLHEIVAGQLWAGDPPEVWGCAQLLIDRGFERHEILHMLMTAVEQAGEGSGARELLRAALDELPRG